MAHNSSYMKARAQARLEDLDWMLQSGENATGAAQRLGLTAKALEKFCRRHDVGMWHRLRANEPLALESNNPDGHNQWSAA